MYVRFKCLSPTVLIKFSLLQPERKRVRMQAAGVNRHLTAITAQSRTGETNTVNIYFTLKFRCTQDVFFLIFQLYEILSLRF